MARGAGLPLFELERERPRSMEVSMRTRVVVAVCATLLLLSALAGAGLSAPPPPNPVTVVVGGQSIDLWPYTTFDFSGVPSDPINLLFPGIDPRQLRQALMSLDGVRSGPLAALPFAGCLWRDAMGEEQGAWADTEGWAGGAVQLVCVNPPAPLGDPFRVHVRFFRQGTLTLGAAHLDFLIPGTAQHQGLSWDLPREFVTYDFGRAGVLTAQPALQPLFPPGGFGTVLRPIYDALVGSGPEAAFLMTQVLGLIPTGPGDVPIPTSGAARVLQAQILFEPEQAKTRTELQVNYNVTTLKPFCATGPTDYVHLQGPLRLVLTTHTNPSGHYSRTYTVSGVLTVTTVATGKAVPATIFESHSALMNDHAAEATQLVSQTLLSRPIQALLTNLQVGQIDRYKKIVSCGQ
jgi:hypothetical protein